MVVRIDNPLFAKCIFCRLTEGNVKLHRLACGCRVQSHIACLSYWRKSHSTYCPTCKEQKEAKGVQAGCCTAFFGFFT